MNLNSNLSPTTGYLIFCIVAVFGLSIYLNDTNLLGYGILILLLFSLASSFDKGSADKNLSALGWTNNNFGTAAVYGIVGGIISIVLGSLLISYTPKTASILVPDFSIAATLLPGLVIAPNVAFIFNMISQWFIVAPSEESMARVLGPLATVSIIKDVTIAYIVGSLIWIFLHVPAYSAQNAPSAMYLVLGLLSVITIALLFITKNIFSAIFAHGTFNTGVLIAGYNIDAQSLYPLFVLIGIVAILLFLRRKP